MLNRLKNLTQRVGGSNKCIDKWLHARKELLVTYCTVIGVKPQKPKHTPFNEKALENFKQNLIDYLLAGHFQIYDTIIQQAEGQSSPKMALTTEIYPKLENNTEHIMKWHDNDLNVTTDDEESYLKFNLALSDIGEALDTRFKLEDQLIQWAWQAVAPESKK